MSEPTFTLEGLPELIHKCEKFRDKYRAQTTVTNYEAAKIVAEAARSRAPIGSSPYDEHPGALLLSIRARGGKFASVTAGGTAEVPYAPPIHWGWPIRRIRPQPFLYHALDARVGEVIALYAERVEALEREVFR